MSRSELAKFIPFETPPLWTSTAPSTLKLGATGGDNTPRGPGFRSTFELAKFLPSTVPHLLGKHHNCSRNINNDKGGDDDQHDGDEDARVMKSRPRARTMKNEDEEKAVDEHIWMSIQEGR